MAQLQHMDAHLDTLSIELYKVNVRVGCIARRQVTMGSLLLRLLLHHLLSWLLILRMRMLMMVMTMILQMMMMEMLALSMRCLLDTLTFCHSRQKREVVLNMRVVILRVRVSIRHFC